MHHADIAGAPTLFRRIEQYAAEDPLDWRVPPMLARMARDGTCFADLNEER